MNKNNNPKKGAVDTTKKQNVSTGRFTDTLKSSGANASTILTLTDEAVNLCKTKQPPRQVVKVLQLLDDLGGTATVGELNDLIIAFMNDKADTFWVDSKHEPYVQDIYPVMSAYLNKMTGKEDWTAKKGSFTLVNIS
jgi:hypothetical protein|tara:strand:- start:101 stop:511 length:411 start_codon:yes stop_codon:yes gene_type:complete